jgi:hypothetical protein
MAGLMVQLPIRSYHGHESGHYAKMLADGDNLGRHVD